MEWLKDKNNQPIVAGIAAVVIVGVLVFMYFTFIKKDSTTTTQTTAIPLVGPQGRQAATGTTQQQPGPGMAYPGMTAPGGVAPTAATQAPPPPRRDDGQPPIQPMETWRDDPFFPVGYSPPPIGPRPKPPIRDFPFPIPTPIPKVVDPKLRPEPAQPARRLAGVMQNTNGGIYAIIESRGESQVVQPGQRLEDGMAVVEKIETDSVLLKTIGERPRYLVVRLAAAPRTQTEIEEPETTGVYAPGPGMMPPALPRGIPPPGAPMPRRR